jgi:uncharacterized protein
MMRSLAALVAGTLFGLGLAVSQMVNPAKVLGFLDIAAAWRRAAGGWDPSLALVMAGALAVTFFGFRLVTRQEAPVFAPSFELPRAGAVDGKLIAGAAIFGVGWGLVGFCPGPALASLAFGLPQSIVFVLAMVAGAWLYRSGGRLAPASQGA